MGPSPGVGIPIQNLHECVNQFVSIGIVKRLGFPGLVPQLQYKVLQDLLRKFNSDYSRAFRHVHMCQPQVHHVHPASVCDRSFIHIDPWLEGRAFSPAEATASGRRANLFGNALYKAISTM